MQAFNLPNPFLIHHTSIHPIWARLIHNKRIYVPQSTFALTFLDINEPIPASEMSPSPSKDPLSHNDPIDPTPGLSSPSKKSHLDSLTSNRTSDLILAFVPLPLTWVKLSENFV